MFLFFKNHPSDPVNDKARVPRIVPNQEPRVILSNARNSVLYIYITDGTKLNATNTVP